MQELRCRLAQIETDAMPNEQTLAERITRRMEQLQAHNYIRTEYDTVANILNIVNLYQFTEITQQETMNALAIDNYALTPDTLLQLFQVYQRNDSLHIPNFITADLMVQLSHIYEVYVLQTVEQRYLAPMMVDLCKALHDASMRQSAKATKADIKSMAAYNAAFFAVAHHLLTGKALQVSEPYRAAVEEELAYIEGQELHRSALLDLDADFDYRAFQPYGHYTRTAMLRRYFKAWKWLQLAPWCGNSRTQLQRAALLAIALQTAKTESGASAMEVYARLLGSLQWFAGQPAVPSMLDAALLLKKERATNITAALGARVQAKLKELANRNTSGASAVRYPSTCGNGIWIAPQPAFADEDVLRAMADPSPDAQRPFPKALDVLAAFGSEAAFNQLFVEDRQDTLWGDYSERMAMMSVQKRQFNSWDASSYHKRLQGVLALLQQPSGSSAFARRSAWNRKMLTSASAAWVKMKHSVLLYGEIPDHAPPLPATSMADSLLQPLAIGYVEPALPFWTRLREWVELTAQTLERHQLQTDTLIACTNRLHRYVAMLEDAARLQLHNERLPDEALRWMAHAGDSICQFTLMMIVPEIDRWEWAAGTDRSVAVAEKVFRRDVAGSASNGTLHATTGHVNNLYVIVEIEGLLYLTKGAAFSYTEFPMPLDADHYDRSRPFRDGM
jgi:hypothetical protein